MSPERREEAAYALDTLHHNKNVFISTNPSNAPLQLNIVKVGERNFYTVDDGETLMNRDQAITFLAQWIESTVIELTPFEYHSLRAEQKRTDEELISLRKLATEVVALMPFAPDLPVSKGAHAALIDLGRAIGYPGL